MKTNTVLMEGKLTWYAVYTRPRSEKKVQEALVKLHIPNYLPLLRVRKKWSDRYKWVEEPVFSSYVFVNIEYDSQSLAIMRIPHVVNFVITGSTPAVISDTDMDLLRLTVENFAESLIIRDTSGLSTGEKVRINDGPFAGKEAVIKRIQGKTLIVLSFPALNKSIEVEIPVEQIAKK
ncbi:MAG: UpxY family transcription antiterminator [Turneriella sp.]